MMLKEFMEKLTDRGITAEISMTDYHNIIELYYTESPQMKDVGGKDQIADLFALVGLDGIRTLLIRLMKDKLNALVQEYNKLEETISFLKIDLDALEAIDRI
jgi:hypothetical protein